MKDIQENTKPKKTFEPINEVVILNTKTWDQTSFLPKPPAAVHILLQIKPCHNKIQQIN